MNNRFPQYTIDYISGTMSLRAPQRKSLEILDEILSSINLKKGMNNKVTLGAVHSLCPTCSDFERDFMSLTFALATGVGKTRLMGAFITYLYTNHNIRNFFVVAPGKTVYEKLKSDLGNPSSEKYVFKSLGCFTNPPMIICDDDYRNKNIELFPSGINIYVFNIDKFNKESSKMKALNEYLGQSFFEHLAELDDLVLLMDESHHYRAEKGATALNELSPLLGLETTATPIVTKNGKQTFFKNVVYEYPLSKAIADGFTRTPYAVTRKDIVAYNFGEEQLDKMMISDGILCHERTKQYLKNYAEETGKRLVKPFMLIVCQNTDHAEWAKKFVSSDEFKNGYYKDKTITVHSKQSGSESDENMELLLNVEKADNPIEIVIHVNMLKEGWDVNNLYTIVPLRTAASKILREQMVGRGLRLPFGERTNVPEIDSVMLTAHDKFNDILAEAQKGDSIFKAGNVIQIEDIEEEHCIRQNYLDFDLDKDRAEFYEKTKLERNETNDELAKTIHYAIEDSVVGYIEEAVYEAKDFKNIISETVKSKLSKAFAEKPDLGKAYNDYHELLEIVVADESEKFYKKIQEKYIPIPKIRITDEGVEEYKFTDFDLDLAEFNQVPVNNELISQNLADMRERREIRGAENLNFEALNPAKVLLDLLRQKPEIDYESCSELVRKLIKQVIAHFASKNSESDTKNIVMMYCKDISNKIYYQMLQHFYTGNSLLKEEVMSVSGVNKPQNYNYTVKCNLYDNFKEKWPGSIKSVLFTGIEKGVFSKVVFDSESELVLSHVLERDKDVLNWLRPAKTEFDISYNQGKRYEPDFVIETKDIVYLTEVKDSSKVNDPDVIAKKERGIQFCKAVSEWAKANNFKEWRYLFIPHDMIQESSSFNNLAHRFSGQSESQYAGSAC
ncbi:MAG: DEAD/DEAH box helicase family protein [Treponema sp.]|nr:DEAD/DEAH box helicase family protein [Treponema sp.]